MSRAPQPLFSPRIFRVPRSLAGFSLVELSVVLVIIGIILFAGIAAWSTIVAGQRISATRAEMENVKRCLINRVMHSEAFPTWERTGMYCNAPRSRFDVEHCLCGKTDAWGNAIRYLSGLRIATEGLGEAAAGPTPTPPAHYVVADPVKDQLLTNPYNQSQVSTSDGPIQSVAFVLISYGSDRQADNAGYGNLFDPDLTASGRPANRIDPANIPNFRRPPDPDGTLRNDLFLVVTSYELASMLRR